MIIWIASYPKSGNTWVRSFLCSYIFSNDNTFDFKLLDNIRQFPVLRYYKQINLIPKNLLEAAEGWITTQQVINLDNKIHFMKTHNAMCSINKSSFTNKENTLGAIYIVRDPRDILISYSNYLNINHAHVLNEMVRNNNPAFLSDSIDNKDIIGSLIGSWSENYNSWKNFDLTKKLIIKYEDLIKDPYNNFLKIVSYLHDLYGLEIKEEKILKSIESIKFTKLQELEKKNLFFENPNKKELFFREGKIGQWQNKLGLDIIDRLEKKFSNDMIELGYL